MNKKFEWICKTPNFEERQQQTGKLKELRQEMLAMEIRNEIKLEIRKPLRLSVAQFVGVIWFREVVFSAFNLFSSVYCTSFGHAANNNR